MINYFICNAFVNFGEQKDKTNLNDGLHNIMDKRTVTKTNARFKYSCFILYLQQVDIKRVARK